MRKFFAGLLFLMTLAPILAVPRAPRPSGAAAADVYARVSAADALLYRTPAGETADDVFFLLPENYYVRLLGETVADGKRAVEYDDLLGYAKSSDIEAVSYIPKYKFGSGTLKIDTPDGNGALLRALPDKSPASQVVGTIEFGTDNIKFYNLCGAGGAWYYVAHNGLRGYLAAASVAVTKELPPASDEAEPQAPAPPDGEDPKPDTLPDGRIWLLVAAIGIPALIVVLLIFRPGRRNPPPPRRAPRYYDDT